LTYRPENLKGLFWFIFILMTGRSAVLNELSGIWNVYLQMYSKGFTTLTFEDWENEWVLENCKLDHIDRIAQNERRHLSKADNMRRRLRKKLEERKNKK